MARGDGTVYLRGNVWWIKFHRDRKPICLSCAGLTEDQARTKLRNEIQRNRDGLTEPIHARVTIAELVEDLLEHYDEQRKDRVRMDAHRYWQKHLKGFFGCMKACKFNTEVQMEYRKVREKTGAARTTINKEIQILGRAFQLGAEGKSPKVLNVPKFVTVGEGRSHLSGLCQGLIYILLVAELRTCYIGKTVSKEGKSRLKSHSKGHFPPTEELNRLAAENGMAVITQRFSVDCSEHDLEWWEAYYCDKYRTNGWTLLNRIQLTNVPKGALTPQIPTTDFS
jgi:hypothetical protein